MLTDRLITRIGSLRRLSPIRIKSPGSSSSSSSVPPNSAPPDTNLPAFQMDYTITDTDTLERVAASHDCTVGELMKLNKLHSRMVFAGQKILVPITNSDDVFSQPVPSLKSSGTQISGIESAEDGIRKGPGGAVPAQIRRGSFAKTQSAPVGAHGNADEVDTDCLQRFLKIKVKQVTESDGTVSGTLLVTPNCLMFDPDVSHPLVKENGPDLYGMVANMDEIISVSVYKEIGGLTGDQEEKKKDIFDPDHLRTPGDSPNKQLKPNNIEDIIIPRNEDVTFIAGMNDDLEHSPKMGSETTLPSITEETKESPQDELRSADQRNRSMTLGDEDHMRARSRSRTSSQNSSNDDRTRSFSELDASDTKAGIGRFSPNAARRSFGKLGRTLSARAKSIQGTVTSGAEKAVQGTRSVAHGVVTHTKSAADTLQSGIENGAKAAADVAGRVVDRGQSLMNESINGVTEIFTMPGNENQPPRSPIAMKREQSLAKLEDLKRQTAEARETSAKDNMFPCATSTDEKPDLFANVDELMDKNRLNNDDLPIPALPFYMAVRLMRNKKKKLRKHSPSSSSVSYDEDFIAFGNKLKREFWFAIPSSQASNIYHFLLQWSPDKYGLDTTSSSNSEEVQHSAMISEGDEKGFIVLNSNADEALTGEKSAPLFGSSLLNREWELVTVSEMCRRLSLDQELEMPIPDGANTSQVLDELMIRQVMDILPPRAEGYPWVNIYNSEKHGFSLSTLYRKMAEFDEDLSPVLLIIRDTKEHVFGAVVSSAIRPSDHYTGTGDSCLLWRFTGEVPHTRELRHYNWTGDNQFFVNAAKDSLSIGAGSGRYGLWLDADLNHGRSQKCETFDNEPLCGENEDFIIQFIEAYGFRM